MKILLFFLSMFASSLFSEENKIVILISTPRSLSTGLLRMMEARQDFEIFHEPTNAPYDAVHARDFYELNFRDDCFKSFEEVTETILAQSKTSNVFVKEVAFSLPEHLTVNNPLLQNSRFVFLIRKPQDVILSFYRKGVPVSHLSEFTGYRQIYELFELIETHAKHPTYLIYSEDLGEHPLESVASFCNHVGISFKPESLTWEDLGSEFTGHKWRDGKISEAVQHWHGNAIRSTCFVPLKTAETDSDGTPTFIEIENLEDRAACHDAYLYSSPYYLALKAKWETLKVKRNTEFQKVDSHE